MPHLRNGTSQNSFQQFNDHHSESLTTPSAPPIPPQIFDPSLLSTDVSKDGDLKSNIIQVLVQRGYDSDLLKLILSKSSYYQSVSKLSQLGLLQNVAVFFKDKDKDKLSVLDDIHQLKNATAQQLCLTLWAKGSLTHDEYIELVKAMDKYPYLAETLIDLDKGYTSVEGIKQCARDPKKHLQASILLHFSKQFEGFYLKKNALNQLDVYDLEHLVASCSVLEKTKIATPARYQLALRTTHEGALLRLLLPYLDSISGLSNRNTLIDLLYLGVEKGGRAQSREMAKITDVALSNLAQELHERFICVKQMLDLNLDKKIAALAAQPESIKACRFRQVIFKVEDQLKKVHERLHITATNTKDENTMKELQNADAEYRRSLYTIAYDGLTHSGGNLKSRLDEAEKKILTLVDPEITSWVQKILTFIAKLIKNPCNSNWWFFSQTKSGKELRDLDKNVMDFIESANTEDANSLPPTSTVPFP